MGSPHLMTCSPRSRESLPALLPPAWRFTPRRTVESRTNAWASSDATRRTMQGNRGRDAKAKLAVRRLVHGAGLRYRVNARPEPDLRRTADLLFTRARVVVFIDGCYWHGCPEHFTLPATNLDYWSTKIGGDTARDVETTTLLEGCGWLVLRFWEHEPPVAVAESIVKCVRERRGASRA